MTKRRPDGDGTVRKRADGRWEGIIVIGHKDNGKPILKSIFAKTQKELMPKLHAMIEQYRDVELTEASRMTLGEWIEHWFEKYATPTIRPNTLRGYRRSAKYIIPILGDKQIRQVTTSDIQRMYNQIKRNGRILPIEQRGQELSDATVRGVHMLLHEIMDAAIREHLIAKNPTNGTTVPKANYKPMKVLNDAQLEIFMEAIKKEPLWYEFFYTEITTGLRRGEICGLKWSNLNEGTGKLRVERSIIMLRGNCRSGLPDIRFHDLRHTFATTALEHGMDIKTLSTVIGHISSATTINIYSHVTDTMQRQAAAKIENSMGNGEAFEASEASSEEHSTPEGKETVVEAFEAYKSKVRKSGTGNIYQVNDHLWTGKYSPIGADGKRIQRNCSAHTREECEQKLAEMIAKTQAEIAEQKAKNQTIVPN